MTTVDDLIQDLQRHRKAAGRNLPIRLKLDVDQAGDELAPADRFLGVERLRSQPCISDKGEFAQIFSRGALLD